MNGPTNVNPCEDVNECFEYQGKIYTSGRGRSCISGQTGAFVYGCSKNVEHVFNLTDKEYTNISKEMKRKKHGEKIVIKNHCGEIVAQFYNIIRRNNVRYFEKKPFCLGCLNTSEPTKPVESIMHGVRIEDRLIKHRKNVAKNKNKRQVENQVSLTTNKLILPQQESNYELKEIEIRKKCCSKVICIDSINNKCFDEQGLVQNHVKRQKDYTNAIYHGIIMPIQTFKTSPQNVSTIFLENMMQHVEKLVELNIPRTKNNDNSANENLMIHLIGCILKAKKRILDSKLKLNQNKMKKIIQKLSSQLSDAMNNDLELYLSKNAFDCDKLQIVGPAVAQMQTRCAIDELNLHNYYLDKRPKWETDKLSTIPPPAEQKDIHLSAPPKPQIKNVWKSKISPKIISRNFFKQENDCRDEALKIQFVVNEDDSDDNETSPLFNYCNGISTESGLRLGATITRQNSLNAAQDPIFNSKDDSGSTTSSASSNVSTTFGDSLEQSEMLSASSISSSSLGYTSEQELKESVMQETKFRVENEKLRFENKKLQDEITQMKEELQRQKVNINALTTCINQLISTDF